MLAAKEIQIAKRTLCIKSFYYFTKEAFKALNPTVVFKDNWHIEYLCREAQEEAQRIIRKETRPYNYLVINVPPRSLKSEIFSVYFPVWVWLQDNSFEFIFSSYSASLSNEHSDKCKNVIRSRWFQKNFSDKVKIKRGKDRVQDWGIVGGGVRLATSTNGTITGKGGMIVTQDDPQDPQRAASETERKASIDFTKETLSSRLNDPDLGLFIVVMQRLHQQDLTGWLLSDPEKRIKHICIPAEYDEETVKLPGIEKYPHLKPYTNGLMFPERFSQKFLKSMLVDLGENGYAGQYLERPSAKGGGLFKKDYFQVITWPQFLQRVAGRRYVTDFFTDGAYTERLENDPTAQGAFIWLDNCLFIRNMSVDHVDSAYLREWIEADVKTNGYTRESFIRMEPKASGLTVIGAVKKESNLNIEAYEYPRDSGVTMRDEKIVRANAAAPTARSGRVFLIEGPWIEKFINELIVFPNGKNDDQVDVMVMAILHYLFMPQENYIEID